MEKMIKTLSGVNLIELNSKEKFEIHGGDHVTQYIFNFLGQAYASYQNSLQTVGSNYGKYGGPSYG